MRVLIVDDDPALANDLAPRLRREGHRVYVRSTAGGLEDLVLAEGIHLTILEPALLPFDRALELCRTVRGESATLLLLVSRVDDVQQCIRLLEAGGDEYLTKPCAPNLLLAHVHALLRRHPLSLAGEGVRGMPGLVRVTEKLWLDLTSQRLVNRGRDIALTEHEFRLLAYLVRHEGAVLSREALLQAVWGAGYEGATREVDVYVRYLRRKLEPDPKRPRYILTVWGRGYRYVRPAESSGGAALGRAPMENSPEHDDEASPRGAAGPRVA